MLVCVFFDAHCTRDRGCSAHPVFPAPSVIEEGQVLAKLGRDAPRDREGIFTRHRLRRRATQFVGWAKRSVPTFRDNALREMVGTAQARLCPPYEARNG